MTSPCKFMAPFITLSFQCEDLVREASTQMPVQKRVVNHIQRRALRHADRKSNKPPLQARIDEEGARARVHAGDDLGLLMDLTCAGTIS